MTLPKILSFDNNNQNKKQRDTENILINKIYKNRFYSPNNINRESHKNNDSKWIITFNYLMCMPPYPDMSNPGDRKRLVLRHLADIELIAERLGERALLPDAERQFLNEAEATGYKAYMFEGKNGPDAMKATKPDTTMIRNEAIKRWLNARDNVLSRLLDINPWGKGLGYVVSTTGAWVQSWFTSEEEGANIPQDTRNNPTSQDSVHSEASIPLLDASSSSSSYAPSSLEDIALAFLNAIAAATPANQTDDTSPQAETLLTQIKPYLNIGNDNAKKTLKDAILYALKNRIFLAAELIGETNGQITFSALNETLDISADDLFETGTIDAKTVLKWAFSPHLQGDDLIEAACKKRSAHITGLHALLNDSEYYDPGTVTKSIRRHDKVLETRYHVRNLRNLMGHIISKLAGSHRQSLNSSNVGIGINAVDKEFARAGSSTFFVFTILEYLPIKDEGTKDLLKAMLLLYWGSGFIRGSMAAYKNLRHADPKPRDIGTDLITIDWKDTDITQKVNLAAENIKNGKTVKDQAFLKHIEQEAEAQKNRYIKENSTFTFIDEFTIVTAENSMDAVLQSADAIKTSIIDEAINAEARRQVKEDIIENAYQVEISTMDQSNVQEGEDRYVAEAQNNTGDPTTLDVISDNSSDHKSASDIGSDIEYRAEYHRRLHTIVRTKAAINVHLRHSQNARARELNHLETAILAYKNDGELDMFLDAKITQIAAGLTGIPYPFRVIGDMVNNSLQNCSCSEALKQNFVNNWNNLESFCNLANQQLLSFYLQDQMDDFSNLLNRLLALVPEVTKYGQELILYTLMDVLFVHTTKPQEEMTVEELKFRQVFVTDFFNKIEEMDGQLYFLNIGAQDDTVLQDAAYGLYTTGQVGYTLLTRFSMIKSPVALFYELSGIKQPFMA